MGGFHASIPTNQRGFEEKESLWKKKHGIAVVKRIYGSPPASQQGNQRRFIFTLC